MADRTRIEWTDASWNPIVGCSPISPGCANCYAAKLAGRLALMGNRTAMKYAGLTSGPRGHEVFNGTLKLCGGDLLRPLGWTRPRRIFVCSMSDLFHEDVPFTWISLVLAVAALCPQHTFQLLTKRPHRLRAYFTQRYMPGAIAEGIALLGDSFAGSFPPPTSGLPWPLPNVWIGTTCEDQERADERVPYLVRTPAVVRFVSYEPALGPLHLHCIEYPGAQEGYLDALRGMTCDDDPTHPALDWVIAGGESGHGARPAHPDWFRNVRDDCAAAGVPFYFKQWGEWAPRHDLDCKAKECTGRPWFNFDPDTSVCRVGRAAAGRLLDGLEHAAFPMTTKDIS